MIENVAVSVKVVTPIKGLPDVPITKGLMKGMCCLLHEQVSVQWGEWWNDLIKKWSVCNMKVPM